MFARLYAPSFLTLYFVGFLFAFQIALSGYYNGPFLQARGITEESFGWVYMLGALGALGVFLFLPILLRAGVLRLTLLFGSVMVVSAYALSASISATTTGVMLALFLGAQMILYPLIDTIIENELAARESLTGRVRGLYLTAANAAFIISPVIAGWVISTFSFEALYAVVGTIGIAFFLVVGRLSKNTRQHSRTHLFRIYAHVLRSSQLRRVLAIQFLLRFLYAVTLVYLSIHLHQLGFGFDTIGILLTLSIIPFALVQFPLGFIGDTLTGEKEFLALGLTLMTSGIIWFGFIAEAHFTMILIALLLVNTGAAITEIMTGSYFFKHVKGSDAGEITAFNALTPLSYIMAPLFAGLVITTFSTAALFITLGLLTSVGIPLALMLKDTR